MTENVANDLLALTPKSLIINGAGEGNRNPRYHFGLKLWKVFKIIGKLDCRAAGFFRTGGMAA
jgi:hypothetical protein